MRDTLCSIGILDIAILTGGLNIELNLVSILNCLQDMIQETKTLPPPAVLDRVSESIGKGKGGGGGGGGGGGAEKQIYDFYTAQNRQNYKIKNAQKIL